jgi:two-component system, cell cycle sensor histidine kinase and response regulator CckA
MTQIAESEVLEGEIRQFQLLLVEDNPGDADLAADRLDTVPDYDFRITIVQTLGDALAAVATKRVDAIILDLNLPDSTGIETLKKLRDAEEEIPIVVLSASDQPELRRTALAEGAQDFIGKNEPAARLLSRSILYAVERHKALSQHRAVERLVSATPDALIVTDEAGVVRFVNPAARHLLDVDQGTLIDQALGRSVREGEVTEIEIPRSEESRTAEIRVAQIEWQRSPAYLTSLRDITDRKKLTAQVLHMQRMESIGLLAGGIAHDFNNLLVSIFGRAEAIFDQVDADSPMSREVSSLLDAAERAAALTKQLLIFARRQRITPRVIDIGDVVIGIERMIRRTMPESIEFVVVVDDDLWPVVADATQIEQVILNLAINARDAMSGAGRLAIEIGNRHLDERTETLTSGDYVEIRVSDTGIGIAPKDLPRIFEPFYTTKEPGRGTGLGLSTSYGVLRQIDGDITVESRLGKGTTFRILLPRYEGAEEPQPIRREAPRSLRGSETILVVDDDPTVLQTTADLLRRNGYEALMAANGDEAERIVDKRNGPIHLLLTDAVMPHMSGHELAARVEGMRPGIKIVIMSGYRHDSSAGANEVNGNWVYQSKPYRGVQLLTTIRRVLDT